MTSNIYVFNQYFLTFIKTVKKSAKSIKERNSTAREILKKIVSGFSPEGTIKDILYTN